MASRRNVGGSQATTAFTSIVGLTLTLLLVGIIAVMALAGRSFERQLRQQAHVQVFFQRDIPPETLAAAQELLRTDSAVVEVVYRDPAKASEELEAALGESFVDFLGYVPLPPVYDLTISPEMARSQRLGSAVARWNDIPGVADVVWQQDLLKRIEAALSTIMIPLVAVAFLFLLVALALMNNTIRLTIFSRRFIIKTMQLVGARPRMIRRPFLRQGMFYGLISGMLSSGGLMALLAGFRTFVEGVELGVGWR
jgi:cell division transport system permease protein